MCGIAGIWNKNKTQIDEEILYRMSQTLVHRGPDQNGLWSSLGIGFAHRRLAIRDLSELGHQPMCDSEEKVWIIYNGEIYNDVELSNELLHTYGMHRRGSSDTEVILLGYLAWGEQVFKRLEGMFAIAIWDSEKQKLLLARDPIGIKPLYIKDNGDEVRFASEIKAITSISDSSYEIDVSAFREFLTLGYTGPDRTTVLGIEQIPPGTCRIYQNEFRDEFNFWSPKIEPTIYTMSTAVEAISETLKNVVKDMLVSDVPVGVFQSGGIDSTAISLSLPSNSSYPLFTASCEDSSYDESQLANIIAGIRGFTLNSVELDTAVDASKIFLDMVHAVDGQLADSSSFALLQLTRLAGQKVKVALSGDGADEFFAGYTTYAATFMSNKIGNLLPRFIAKAIGEAFLRRGSHNESRLPITELIGRFCVGHGLSCDNISHVHWRRLAMPEIIKIISGEALINSHDDGLDGYRSSLHGGNSVVENAMIADQTFYLPGDLLQKVDRMSMAASLEIRVPFLDKRMMELASHIDISLMLGNMGNTKLVLRELTRAMGAPEKINSGAKKGFNVPVAKLLRQGLAPLSYRYLVLGGKKLEPYLSSKGLKKLWHEHYTSKRNHGYLLWSALVFSVWYQKVILGENIS